MPRAAADGDLGSAGALRSSRYQMEPHLGAPRLHKARRAGDQRRLAPSSSTTADASFPQDCAGPLVERQFPVIPVEAGIIRFFSKKCSPIPKTTNEINAFPWQANQEFCRPNRELNPQN